MSVHPSGKAADLEQNRYEDDEKRVFAMPQSAARTTDPNFAQRAFAFLVKHGVEERGIQPVAEEVSPFTALVISSVRPAEKAERTGFGRANRRDCNSSELNEVTDCLSRSRPHSLFSLPGSCPANAMDVLEAGRHLGGRKHKHPHLLVSRPCDSACSGRRRAHLARGSTTSLTPLSAGNLAQVLFALPFKASVGCIIGFNFLSCLPVAYL